MVDLGGSFGWIEKIGNWIGNRDEWIIIIGIVFLVFLGVFIKEIDKAGKSA